MGVVCCGGSQVRQCYRRRLITLLQRSESQTATSIPLAAPPNPTTKSNRYAARLRKGDLRIGRVEKRRVGGRRGEVLLAGGFRQMPVPQSAPLLRFLFPLIERNVRISRIALSDWLHVRPTAGTLDRGKRSRRMRPSSP